MLMRPEGRSLPSDAQNIREFPKSFWPDEAAGLESLHYKCYGFMDVLLGWRCEQGGRHRMGPHWARRKQNVFYFSIFVSCLFSLPFDCGKLILLMAFCKSFLSCLSMVEFLWVHIKWPTWESERMKVFCKDGAVVVDEVSTETVSNWMANLLQEC